MTVPRRNSRISQWLLHSSGPHRRDPHVFPNSLRFAPLLLVVAIALPQGAFAKDLTLSAEASGGSALDEEGVEDARRESSASRWSACS
jgi:hypothetical protein